MGTIRFNITVILLLLNVVPLFAVRRTVNAWIRPKAGRRLALICAGIVVLLLNVPLSIFWFRSVDEYLLRNLPALALRGMFYPSLAWYTTALLCTLLLGPAYMLLAAGRVTRKRRGQTRPDADHETAAISRRSLLAGVPGLIVPAVYGATAYRLFDAFDQVDVSPEQAIPIPYLPKSLGGMTVVQLTDLHVGPFIRQKELQYWVHLVNQLRPDLVVLTGDLIDHSLDDLPDAVAGLRGFRSTFGVLAVLGNHDLTSDPYSSRGALIGGETIAQELSTIGIRTLRNEVVFLGPGKDRLAVMGLDWVSRPGSRNFYSYRPVETRIQLARMAEQLLPETPSMLLAHHPDTFSEVPPHRIGLTLAGHTHGGGQVVFYRRDGVPVGVFSSRFKYPGGFFQEDGCSLYVNRGLGYLGVPIRINCPPEISRFRLVSPEYRS